MNSKIIVLDPNIANQIAAGEVVERPASIVKELVENSIDAKSTRVTIDILGSGLESIKVADNGEGMTASEVQLAFVRHATSKIRYQEDLFKISSLGFRGEALPSIAAVSQVEVLTRTENQLDGTRIILKGGKQLKIEPIGCPVGTQVWIKNIFFNTPARQKFIKSLTREKSAIINIVTRLALANPHISFKLISNGRLILQTSGNNNLLEVVANVYTLDVAKNLIFVEQNLGGILITGYISKHHLYRSNREMQSFFINHRYVHCVNLSRALEEGYENKLPNNRYPLCILNIFLSPDQLDVNVHPTKMEVRIFREEELCGHLKNLVNEYLVKSKSVKKIALKTQPILPMNSVVQLEFSSNAESQDKKEDILYCLQDETKINTDTCLAPVFLERPVQDEYIAEATKELDFSHILPIGQLHNSYVLAQSELGLYIIDQHAAHERIYYEEFKKRYTEGFYSQTLALPLSIELTYSEVEKLIENILLFNSFGIIVEHFGENTFILRGLPQGFSAQEGQDLVSFLLSELDTSRIETLVKEDYLKLLACKKAIKAKQKLSIKEMEHLIEKLGRTDFPYTCPHGRPTIITFSIDEVHHKFLRT